MRDDDYVIGLVFKGQARAYPVWIIDNYHVVNDCIEGRRVLVTSCERCQSGSAFEVDGLRGNQKRKPLFRAAGVLNATLIMKDLRTGSYWNHYEGAALRGRAAGDVLAWIPTFHLEWATWATLHPDTNVMLPPEDPHHPDPRHGHGREEFFSRPGIDPDFLPTITGELDTTYPENEMVLTLEEGRDNWTAYPLREVQREGGVVNVEAAAEPTVVLAGPRADGFTMAAFSPELGGRRLSFERDNGAFRDIETGSRWTIEGLATRGPLEGERLAHRRWFYLRWHAWVYSHRNTHIFRSTAPLPEFTDDSATDRGEFPALRSTLRRAGKEVRFEGPLVTQRKPRESLSSMAAYVDGQRINIHRFRTQAAARDFDALAGAWSGRPLKALVNVNRTLRRGCFVLESDPENRFADPAQLILRPETQAWGVLLSDLGSIENVEAQSTSPDEVAFADVLRRLRLSGLEVIEAAFLPPSQLRPQCINGIAFLLEADSFLLYRFESVQAATAYAAGEEHCVHASTFVLRSTPDSMYLHQPYEIAYAGDHTIRWSTLLDDPRLPSALKG
ncbi:MAG: DUF3179 domain-containing protein [Actinobacteria bacterium]|nr:DUF3179 domain-containing protein [Actinomycetota bacterium]MDQ3533194.1 DUF3179 domain-containing protein [Actinomycetota bacterium]